MGLVPHPALIAAEKLHHKRAETIAAAQAAAQAAAAAGEDGTLNASGEADESESKHRPKQQQKSPQSKERRGTGTGTGTGTGGKKSGASHSGAAHEIDTDLVQCLSLSNAVIDSGTFAAICLSLPLCKSMHTLRLTNCGLTLTHIRELALTLPKTGITTLAIDENPLPPFSGVRPTSALDGVSATGSGGSPHAPFSSLAVIQSLARLLRPRAPGTAGAAGGAGGAGSTGGGAAGVNRSGAGSAATTKPTTPSNLPAAKSEKEKEKEKESNASGFDGDSKAPGSAGSVMSGGSSAIGGVSAGGAGSLAAFRNAVSVHPGSTTTAGGDQSMIESGEVFAELIENNSVLQSLSLRANDLGYFALNALCAALKKNHTLLTLNLSYNRLGDVLGTDDPLSSAVTPPPLPLPTYVVVCTLCLSSPALCSVLL